MDYNTIVHRLKNDNVDAAHPMIWRYQHFNSYTPYARKRATISAALQKVAYFASNSEQLIMSGIRKIREFEYAGYPHAVLKYCLNYMASKHNYS